MSVKLSSRQVGDVTVLDVAGRITLGEGSSALRDTLRDLVSKGQKKILLNLGEVSYIDSSGIGELVSGFTTTCREYCKSMDCTWPALACHCEKLSTSILYLPVNSPEPK